MKIRSSESGAVTVEAAIALPIFMFAIITILSIVNICTAQARITAAVNTTAKEISQYTYMYSLTGFQKTHQEWANAGSEASGKVSTIVETTNAVFNEIEKLANSGLHVPENMDDLLSQAETILGSAENLQGHAQALDDLFSDLAKDPKKLIFGLAKLVASKAINQGMSKLIAAPLAKHMCKKHLVSEKDGSVDAYLKSLFIVPNGTSYLNGLDFGQSTMFVDGDSRIAITCKYKIKPIQLLPIKLEFTFRSTAITKLWPADQTLGEIFGN